MQIFLSSFAYCSAGVCGEKLRDYVEICGLQPPIPNNTDNHLCVHAGGDKKDRNG